MYSKETLWSVLRNGVCVLVAALLGLALVGGGCKDEAQQGAAPKRMALTEADIHELRNECAKAWTKQCVNAVQNGYDMMVQPAVRSEAANQKCEEAICAHDAFCCTTSYDQACVNLNKVVCRQKRTKPASIEDYTRADFDSEVIGELLKEYSKPMSQELCTKPHAGPGCNNRLLQAMVCGYDHFCCANFDQSCADWVIANQ